MKNSLLLRRAATAEKRFGEHINAIAGYFPEKVAHIMPNSAVWPYLTTFHEFYSATEDERRMFFLFLAEAEKSEGR